MRECTRKRCTIIQISIFLFLAVILAINSFAEVEKAPLLEGLNHDSKHSMHRQSNSRNDRRVSLAISSPEIKQHQLSEMRLHLEVVEEIIGLISEDKFDEASLLAHSKLGLTDKMKKMCEMFSTNEEFRETGFAFHRSGDELGRVLKTRNLKKSLVALNTTLGHCTGCHAMFKQ